VSSGCDSATKWRQVVATGANPWTLFKTAYFSPEGTTCDYAEGFLSSLQDSPSLFIAVHGLAPVATTCRPVRTESHFCRDFAGDMRNKTRIKLPASRTRLLRSPVSALDTAETPILSVFNKSQAATFHNNSSDQLALGRFKFLWPTAQFLTQRFGGDFVIAALVFSPQDFQNP